MATDLLMDFNFYVHIRIEVFQVRSHSRRHKKTIFVNPSGGRKGSPILIVEIYLPRDQNQRMDDDDDV